MLQARGRWACRLVRRGTAQACLDAVSERRIKTVLVTGGGRGLGKGLVLALAARGHQVVLTARGRAAGEATLREAPPGAALECFEADLSSFASRLHLPDSRGVPVHFDFDDPNLERGYHPERAYKNSKLALVWFVNELARRVPKERATVHAVCPGFVPETAKASTKGVMHFVMAHVMPHMPFATRLDDAIDSLCFTALDPSLDETTGDFWAEQQPFVSSPQSRSVDDAKRFWAWCEAATKSGSWP